jgi:hypothetical protein
MGQCRQAQTAWSAAHPPQDASLVYLSATCMMLWTGGLTASCPQGQPCSNPELATIYKRMPKPKGTTL